VRFLNLLIEYLGLIPEVLDCHGVFAHDSLHSCGVLPFHLGHSLSQLVIRLVCQVKLLLHLCDLLLHIMVHQQGGLKPHHLGSQAFNLHLLLCHLHCRLIPQNLL